MGDQKSIREANFDAGSGTLPTAPGSAWMMLGKKGARHSFAYMQMRPSTAVQKPPLLGAPPAQRLGPAFICLLSLGRKRETGLPVLPTKLTDTESSQHPCTGGVNSLSLWSMKLGSLSPSHGPPLTPTLQLFPCWAGTEGPAQDPGL